MNITGLSSIDHPDHSRTSFVEMAGERVLIVSPRNRMPIANVLLIHGLSDYPARHVRNARRLAERGYRTVMVELAGHGGQSEDWSRTMPLYQAYANADRTADVLRWLRSDMSFSADERRMIIDRQYTRLERTSVEDHLKQVGRVFLHLRELPLRQTPPNQYRFQRRQ